MVGMGDVGRSMPVWAAVRGAADDDVLRGNRAEGETT
jgi:hypothetical protein